MTLNINFIFNFLSFVNYLTQSWQICQNKIENENPYCVQITNIWSPPISWYVLIWFVWSGFNPHSSVCRITDHVRNSNVHRVIPKWTIRPRLCRIRVIPIKIGAFLAFAEVCLVVWVSPTLRKVGNISNKGSHWQELNKFNTKLPQEQDLGKDQWQD